MSMLEFKQKLPRKKWARGPTPEQKKRGKGREFSPSVDKIDPKLGYVKGNIRIISYRANRLRNDATLSELRQLVKYVEEITRGDA